MHVKGRHDGRYGLYGYSCIHTYLPTYTYLSYLRYPGATGGLSEVRDKSIMLAVPAITESCVA